MRMLPHFCMRHWEGFEERDIVLASPGSPGKKKKKNFASKVGAPWAGTRRSSTLLLSQETPHPLAFTKASAFHHLTLYWLLFG